MTLITNTLAALPGGKRNFNSVAAFQRPNNVTGYSVGDVMGIVGAAAIVFPGCSRSGTIDRVRLSINDVDSSMTFSFLLFDTEPTNFADNAALALVDGDLEKLIGRWDFAQAPALAVASDWTVMRAALDYDALGRNPFTSNDGQNLFGLLVVTAAFTPVADQKVNIRLQGTHDLL